MEAVCFENGRYPCRLREIPDPPPVLWTKGDVAPSARRVAVIGTRRASSYGRRVARDLCRDLAQCGIEVVSGMAHGIDGAAHEAVVKLRGRTLAVLACGLDVSLGSERDLLRDAILASGGAVVSEYNPGTRPCAEHFPARNRIISGLSDAVVIVEAPARSGALITAEFALEQGREVLAVPGSIFALTSEGCHQLIKDGAAVVTRASDVLEAAGLASHRAAGGQMQLQVQVGGTGDAEARVFGALRQGSSGFDEIVAQAGIDPVECARALGMLEIRGLARRLTDGSYEVV
jgi:DNA processing protein